MPKENPHGNRLRDSSTYKRVEGMVTPLNWRANGDGHSAPANKLERRAIQFEVRVDEENGGPPVIRGYAAVFDSPTLIFGEFYEVIRKGAFSETIKKDDIRALWNHNNDHVLGRTTNGTLKLAEDDHGLLVEITPPDTQYARDRAEEIKGGYVDQMSFAFSARKEEWTTTKDDKPMRELLDAVLFDVSPCTFPAYPDTEVAIRSFLDHGGRAHQSGGDSQEQNPEAGKIDRQAQIEILRSRLEPRTQKSNKETPTLQGDEKR